MREKKTTWRYRLLRFFIDLFFPAFRIVGLENLPKDPCIIVGNHSQIYGPIFSELRLDVPHETWCAGELMNRKEAAAYAFRDFWSFKPRWTHPFFRLLSVLVTPIALCLFNNAHTVPVYHDVRLRNTYRLSVEDMEAGESLVIFPEKNEKQEGFLYAFQDKFVDTARFYHKKTGCSPAFVPLYIAPALRTAFIGRPQRFDADAPIAEERERLCRELAASITAMAEAQPRHRVVPYRNIPKKEYPWSLPSGSKKT